MTLRSKAASLFAQGTLWYFTQLPALKSGLEGSLGFDDFEMGLAAVSSGLFAGHMALRAQKMSLSERMRSFYDRQGIAQSCMYGLCAGPALELGADFAEASAQTLEMVKDFALPYACSAVATTIYGWRNGWFGGDDRRGGGFDDSPDPDPDPGRKKPLPFGPDKSPVNDYSPVMSPSSGGIESILNEYKLSETDNDSRSKHYVYDI